MIRRSFLKFILVAPMTSLFSKTFNLNIKMKGDLDDDLIILKHSFKKVNFKLIDCFQMHNQKGIFKIGGKLFKSIQIPGFIDYDKNLNIEEDEVISIFTANERLDSNPNNTLNMRTHYKSTSLSINNSILFPSLLPEKNDVSNYPTWYEENENAGYNYYQLWENAVVNTGLIVRKNDIYKISCLDKNNEILCSQMIDLSKGGIENISFKKFRNVKKISSHPFAETDGDVFEDGKKMNDKLIKENAIHKIILENSSKDVVFIELPFPSPYINRIYIKSIGENNV